MYCCKSPSVGRDLCNDNGIIVRTGYIYGNNSPIRIAAIPQIYIIDTVPLIRRKGSLATVHESMIFVRI